MQVKTTAYQGNLQNCLVYAPSSEPFVSSVCLYFAVSPFGLYGAVHSEQRTMNAVQVVENLLVEGSQFIVQPNDPVKSAFVTFRSMWAAAAILALVKLYGSPVLVALYRFVRRKRNSLPFGQTSRPASFTRKFTARYGSSRYFLSLVSFSYMGNFMYFSIPCSWQYR